MQKHRKSIFQSIVHSIRVSNISFKLSIILVASIIIPMIIFAVLSLSISSKADFQAVSRGNQKAAVRTAEQIEQYIINSINILRSIAENINGLHLIHSQKDIVLKNHVLQFQEFDKIVITNRQGKEIVTSEMGGDLKDRSDKIAFEAVSRNKIYFSDVSISENFVPFMTIAVPSFLLGEFDGAIIGTINLIDMWRLVDSLTIEKQGYALVVSKTGLLVAHGEGNSKPGIIRKDNLSYLQITGEVLEGKASILEYENPKGIKVLGTAAPIKTVNWGLIIEQPLSEAYASTYKMGKRLVMLGLVILIIMSIIAFLGVNRSVIRPLKKLIGGIKDKDMSFDSGDEFSSLASFYNFMSKSVVDLEAALEKYSKSASLGKVSVGFIHDLKNPIDNVIRVTRHLVKHINDKELKEFSKELLDEESKNISHLISKVREPMVSYTPAKKDVNINTVLNNACMSMEGKLEDHRITVKKELAQNGKLIKADKFDLERIIKNLINNAIEAMDEGGVMTLSSKIENGFAKMSVSDTGCGIEPERLKTLFTKLGSGKKDGWGVGLSVSKELVEKMDGRIEAESEPGKGSTFTLQFKSQ